MVKLFPRITLSGDNFSPKRVDNDSCSFFSNKKEKGDIATTGRYKGKPLPYGSAVIASPENITGENEKILWVIEKYLNHKEKILNCGAEDIVFHIDVNYIDQCNLAFDPEIIKKISDLNISLTITCWESDCFE